MTCYLKVRISPSRVDYMMFAATSGSAAICVSIRDNGKHSIECTDAEIFGRDGQELVSEQEFLIAYSTAVAAFGDILKNGTAAVFLNNIAVYLGQAVNDELKRRTEPLTYSVGPFSGRVPSASGNTDQNGTAP